MRQNVSLLTLALVWALYGPLSALPANGALIPKGVSSLLTNSKVPAGETVFHPEEPERVAVKNVHTSSIFTDALIKLRGAGTGAGTNNNNSPLGSGSKRIPSLQGYGDTSSDFTNMYVNDQTTGILLSSNVVYDNSLQKLGIKGSSVNLPVIAGNDVANVNRATFLPINYKSAVIFNVQDSIDIDALNLSGTIPLDVKGSYQVDDYNILVPITYLQKLKLSSVFLEEFLVQSSEGILYYNQPLEFETPLLVTFIKPSLSTSASSSKLSSLFFEIVSKNWFQSSASTMNLLQSSYCFVNDTPTVSAAEHSICIKVDDNSRNIRFTPAYKDGKLNWNGMVANRNDHNRNKREIAESEITIQVGRAHLFPNGLAFTNTTNCKTPEAYPQENTVLEGSLFGAASSSNGAGAVAVRPFSFVQVLEARRLEP